MHRGAIGKTLAEKCQSSETATLHQNNEKKVWPLHKYIRYVYFKGDHEKAQCINSSICRTCQETMLCVTQENKYNVPMLSAHLL